MPMKKYKPEQVVTLLRQIEVGVANGKLRPMLDPNEPNSQRHKRMQVFEKNDQDERIWSLDLLAPEPGDPRISS